MINIEHLLRLLRGHGHSGCRVSALVRSEEYQCEETSDCPYTGTTVIQKIPWGEEMRAEEEEIQEVEERKEEEKEEEKEVPPPGPDCCPSRILCNLL